MQLSPVVVKIAGRHITVISTTTADGFPKGIIAEGTLMWHPKTKEWIIGLEAGDRDAVEVGGCSGGPEVVDLKKRIFWTC